MANIVHLGKYYPPDLGGIESVTASLARGAARHGHSVSVVCFKKRAINTEDTLDGVRIFRAPIAKTISSQPLGLRYFAQCYQAAKNADIVHLHVPNMVSALSVLLIKKNTPLLVHWHSDVINKGLLGKIIKPLETALLRRANVIVAATPAYAHSSQALKTFKTKTKVIPYGVDQTDDIDSVKKSSSFTDQFKDNKIILATGRLVPYKGFNFLIAATKLLSEEAVVIIIGDGPLKSDLQQEIEKQNLKDRVVLAGRLSDAEMHELLSRATLFCLPSIDRAEAFGVVMIEAMSYGVPIVASDIAGSGVPWVNQHGVSGLNVPVGNTEALANACNQILKSKELRDKLSRGAHQRYLTEFTETVSVNRMMDLYSSLLTH